MLDTSGGLLEGIRLANGNNAYTFPPRTVISDQTALDNAANTSGRAEYMLFATGQVAGAIGIEIADPTLSFFWCRNNSTVTRFDYDMYRRRWNTLPGGPPLAIGVITNTAPLLMAPIPDPIVSQAEAPYQVFLGIPRQVTFTYEVVESDADFSTNLPAGKIQISLSTGDVNFSNSDVTNPSYIGQTVYVSQQAFNPRSKSKGIFGTLPLSSSENYLIYLNPIPGQNQTPRIRISYQNYLIPISYPTEASLVTPPTGSVAWSQDTGRTLFSPADITANPAINVYYDGVTLGQIGFTRTIVNPIVGKTSFYPTPIGNNPLFANVLLDPFGYIFFVDPFSPRYYFTVIIQDSTLGSLSGPSAGQILIDVATGNIYINQSDAILFNGNNLVYINATLQMESGVGVQFYRSGVNGGGFEQADDFYENYTVVNQVIADGLTSAPFVMLPTVPIQDSTLAFNILQSVAGGFFVGSLVDSSDPTQQAYGYSLNLDQKQVGFTQRTIISQTLTTQTSSIKLANSAILSAGFEVTRNGTPLVSGVDFRFNQNAGILDFLQPIGEDDPNNIINIPGVTTLPNTFTTPLATFTGLNGGMFLFVDQGPNAGLYQITGVPNPFSVLVTPDFPVAIATQADVRTTREIVADRFFEPFTPPLTNFSIMTGTSVNGPFTQMDQSQFNVIQSAGQVNLTNPTNPGQVFQVNYLWLQSPDNGVTVTPTPITGEFAAFKIRQETATFVPNSTTITFNPNKYTVQINQGITLYVNGVTQAPTTYNFMAPGTLIYNTPLTATDQVVLSYYVAEAPGGKTSFNLVNSPISVDYPTIVAGATSATFNGDQTSVLQTGGVFLFNGSGSSNSGSGSSSGPLIDLVVIGTVTYNAANNNTTVQFNVSPANYGNGVSSISVCQPVLGINAPNYMVTESNPVDMVSNNTSTISINGFVNYAGGTIVLVNNDPYLVNSSTYSSSKNVTTLTLADKTLHDYIMPVLQHTIRPVLGVGTDFSTLQVATLAFPFTLILTGSTPKVLVKNVDYIVGDGGIIKLTQSIGSGNILNALYVARAQQAAGTEFVYNYAYTITPTTTNGMMGQQLAETYDLFSPDTFFYNIETIPSFIPVVIASLQQQTPSGSGPNTQNVSSPQTKDQGTQSLYWPETHLGNEDTVVQRLLLFYNELVNNYEDILSDLDGRVVGGVNGKFRYNGVLGEVVSTYTQILNDIDDEIVLYNTVQLVSFNPFTFENVPVYGTMYQSNGLSRIYPTANSFVTVAINDKTAAIFDFLDVLGSTMIGNLTTFSTTSPSRAYSPLASVLIIGSTATCITANEFDGTSTVAGEPNTLIPAFAVGDIVQLYKPDGSINGSEGIISTITPALDPTYTGAYTIVVDYSTAPPPAPTLTTILTTASNNMPLPQAVLNVVSTAGFPTSGSLNIQINSALQAVTYTGTTATTFTGCMGGTGMLSTGNTVIDATPGPINVPVSTQKGGIVQDTSSVGHGTYVPDRDFLVSDGSGNFHNIALPWPFNIIQTQIQGNELVDINITFSNTATTPVRIPVLDGSCLSDNGRYPLPPLARIGEQDYLNVEAPSLNSIATVTVTVGGTVITNATFDTPLPVLPTIGQSISFLNGPNFGISSVVTSVSSNFEFVVAPPFPHDDLTGSEFYIEPSSGSLSVTLAGEIAVISTNVQADISAPGTISPPPYFLNSQGISPTAPLIGPVNSELISIDQAIRSFGQQQYTGTTAKATSATVLTDPNADYATAFPEITNGSYLYVTSGPNMGLYQIKSLTDNTITINPNAPYPIAFPSVGATSPYLIFQPWSFISSAEFSFASSFQAQTLAFLASTQAWAANPSAGGAAARAAAVNARVTAVTGFITTIQGLLGQTDNLYNTRYLWIQQRTDMKVGLLVQQAQAVAQRITNVANLIANQQKLFIINSLIIPS
jgi:hypothetical protein